MSGEPIRLLLDEHVWEGLTDALAQRGYDAAHVRREGLRGIEDEPLLERAASEGRALFTYNGRDFVPLARRWYETGRGHAGSILSTQLMPAELFRQIDRLLNALSAADIKNTVRWLQEFRS